MCLYSEPKLRLTGCLEIVSSLCNDINISYTYIYIYILGSQNSLSAAGGTAVAVALTALTALTSVNIRRARTPNRPILS